MALLLNDTRKVVIFVQLLLERYLCLEGVILVFAVDAVDALHRLLVAGPHLHLPMRRLPFAVLLARVKFDQLFFEFGGLLLLLVSLLALLFLVVAVDLFQVLLVDFGLFSVLLLYLTPSRFIFLTRRLDLVLQDITLFCVCLLFPSKKRVLVL